MPELTWYFQPFTQTWIVSNGLVQWEVSKEVAYELQGKGTMPTQKEKLADALAQASKFADEAKAQMLKEQKAKLAAQKKANALANIKKEKEAMAKPAWNPKGNVDVNPATVSPAQAAAELRVTIREWLTQSFQADTPAVGNMMKKHDLNWKNAQKHQNRLNELKVELEQVVKTRSVPMIRKKIEEITECQNQIYACCYGLYNNGRWGFSHSGSISFDDLGRAYSLIQVIPTTEAPTTERAATTIRAITAILKVYYGVDVDKTIKELPDVMTPLLKAIKNTDTEKVAATDAAAGEVNPFAGEEEDS